MLVSMRHACRRDRAVLRQVDACAQRILQNHRIRFDVLVELLGNGGIVSSKPWWRMA